MGLWGDGEFIGIFHELDLSDTGLLVEPLSHPTFVECQVGGQRLTGTWPYLGQA